MGGVREPDGFVSGSLSGGLADAGLITDSYS